MYIVEITFLIFGDDGLHLVSIWSLNKFCLRPSRDFDLSRFQHLTSWLYKCKQGQGTELRISQEWNKAHHSISRLSPLPILFSIQQHRNLTFWIKL